MRRSSLLLLAVGVAVLAIAGLIRGPLPDAVDDEPTVVVDERAGSLHGVRFSETSAEVRERLGEPTDAEDGFFPAGVRYTGPPSIPAPGGRPTPLHFDDTAYLISPDDGVQAMATVAGGARTRAGVEVGDALARVREEYEPVVCGEEVGGEGEGYDWCRARVGPVSVFFGGDPVASITLTRDPDQ